MGNTGRYVYDRVLGQIVKVSDKVTIKDKPKPRISAEKDMYEAYKSLEQQGKLNQVDDKEIWKKYADRP